MKTLLMLLLFLMPLALSAQTWPSSLKGRWTFDDPINLLQATVGNDLVLDSLGAGEGVHTAIAGPESGDGAVTIAKGSYYHCYHNIPANGGGTLVNEYSLMVDFRIPSIGPWYSFLQSDLSNTTDGDYWVGPDGTIGIADIGYSAFAVEAGKWYRLVITADLGSEVKYYIDGQLIFTGNMSDPSAVDGRFALSAGAGALNDVFLFGDESGDDADFDIAQVAIFGASLTQEEVSGLSPVAQVIPATLKGLWKFDDPGNLLKATIGNDLVIDSTGSGPGLHEVVAGPASGDGAVSIKKGSFYHCYHNIPANGGGNFVNEYSLLIDFRAPSIGPWYTFFQTNPGNTNDGEMFANSTGALGNGTLGYSTITGNAGVWYRLVVTVDAGSAINYYVNGFQIWQGNMTEPSTGVDGRWTLYPNDDLNDLLLFADNDGDDGDIDVSQVAVYSGILTETEISDLGPVVSDAVLKGKWTFDDPDNLLNATVGNGLALDSLGSGEGQHVAIDGPSPSDGAVTIKKGSFYHCAPNIEANGGGSSVNQYSLLIDYRIPSVGSWYTFYQTAPENDNDGEFFVHTNGSVGVGALGYSPLFHSSPGQWYRMVISVDLGNSFRTYINGELVRSGLMTDPATGIDGRWSLHPASGLNDLLLFADNDGDDADIDIAQVAVYEGALNAAEVALLGRFEIQSSEVILPYLETPTPTSVYINWHNSKTNETKVVYNTDSLSFPMSATGSNQIIYQKVWHTVKLTGLTPNTTYYYKCITGSDTSAISPFRTPSLPGTEGSHIRFAIISDSQEDTVQSAKTAKAMKEKFMELYGADWYNHVNLVMHTGDVIQNTDINEYQKEYFRPFSELTRSVPFMITIGNHEQPTSDAFYQYMHYEDFSDVQYPDALCEKYYSFVLGNVQFIAVNSGSPAYRTLAQRDWLQDKLEATVDDTNVDFVFTFGHQGISEIWPNGNNGYVNDTIFPILAQYPKVGMYSCGHSHNFESGTHICNNSENRDFRTMLFGGAGGTLDRWGMYGNQTDLPDVHKSFDYHGYAIVDVDMDNGSYQATAYSLGNSDTNMYNVIIDGWHGVVNRNAPTKPAGTLPAAETVETSPTLVASAFTGADNDSLMSSHFQVTATPGDFSTTLLDTIRHWTNIYNVDEFGIPYDRNSGIDLSSLKLKVGLLEPAHTYAWRVRYRDHNCRWSEWSDARSLTITTTSVNDGTLPDDQVKVYPNPASDEVHIYGSGILEVDLLTSQGACLKHYEDIGDNPYTMDISDIETGIYMLKIYTEKGESTKKLVINNR